ncbi:hypothetical protein BHE83_23525 (plasmid) [Xanthomonas euvesicatoria pv. vesicatoria str. 85-10]|uniref:Uncharacterized protein n=1 Tax=Xanthomonas euvesicatoria pv. vesicatoria (strain 85-10) TaxID=316273 RepID=Q3C0G3_XANE5|nr:hypothetical protein [Xanthomonas euvesicatoria]AOY69557.1 hypothetical protein BHE83_23525 [Xanthomonas euvesicatoria pv. vesicatoria str. 85-10]MCC8577860.1 hypothetical protein [Xanthomonas euvesicatoria pv. euvesicatoria]CAJ19748.1 conserved hypothetical protein [Xanthomonas euvesicatoria pv. vesicatoria str. 85-10]
MPETIKLDTARELAVAGSIRDTVLLGQRGGFLIIFRMGMSERVLATKYGVPRLFSGLDAAAKVLREISITRFQVDASDLVKDDSTRRRRPDRAAALKQTYRDAALVLSRHINDAQ